MMANLRLSFLYIPFIFLLVWPGYAQDVSLRAFVSSNNVSLDTQFQYSVEISGSTTKMPDVTYPDFKDFFVLSGPNTSTSIQWVNGNMTSTKTYSFHLKPKKEGKLNIGVASLKHKGKTYRTNSISIQVSKGSESVSSRQNNSTTPKKSKDSEISGDNLYLKTLVSDRDVYLGEQIIVEYKLYFRVNVRGYDFEKLPSSPGFWAEEIEMPSQPVIDNEIINGINYNVATLKKYALFPTQAGKLVIEPLKVTLEALVRSKRRRSVFDSFFDDPFGSTVQKKIASKAIEVKINELSKNNQPADFSGAVGKYKLSVMSDKKTAKVNEAISLKIKLSGTGNIKLLELPAPQIPPDIEKYDPKFTSKVNVKTANINGSKQAEYILIPRLPGEYTIKPVSFSYFDPAVKAYKILKSKQIDINITGEVPKLAGTQIQYSRQEVALLGQDIRFIKESSRFMESGKQPYQSGFFWMALISGVVLFSGFVFYNDYAAKISGDLRLSRSKKAGRIATRLLKEAKKHLNSENSANFYKAISLALRGFVQDKLNLEMSDFNTPGARKRLMDMGIDAETIEEYIVILDESDFRQFANSPSSETEKQDTYNKTKKLLIKLEKWI